MTSYKSMSDKPSVRSPWFWVPSLYFAQGIPYVAVMIVSVLMYKRLGVSNTDIALYTSWLNLPWVIKPFWSPFAADGFYMLALDSHEQAFFVGIRSTFYRIAIIAGQGVLVMFAGFLENSTGNIPLAWSVTFFILGGLFLALFLYHRYILPLPKGDKLSATVTPSTILKEFFATFTSFFKKKQAFVAILFMLLYRFPEAQLAKLVTPFLVDPREVGGLGLSTAEIGLVYGTIGTIGLTLGGILGGIAASAGGLKKWIWPMALAISLPDAVFIYLSSALPDNLWIVNICVFIEQFGYGFGFTAYMLYLIYYSDGEHKTAHYAICTAFMALGLMLPGMAAGWLQEQMGYENFFWWVMGCCLVTLLVTACLKIDPEFGKKKQGNN